MTFAQSALIALFAVMLVLFAWGRFRHDVVAFGGLMAAVVLGVVPAETAFSGFGNTATVTVACMLVLTHALGESGITDRFSQVLDRWTGTVTGHVGALSGMTSALSTVMNNVGALALVLPLAMQSANRSGHSPSQILMPVSFAALLGGLVTLIGTPPNIITATFRREVTGSSFAMFDFTWVGLPLAVTGIAFLSLIGWRLLPKRRSAAADSDDYFEIGDYVIEVRVDDSSKLIGKTMGELGDMMADNDAVIVALLREGRSVPNVPRRFLFRKDDILVLEVSPRNLDALIKKFGFSLVVDDDLSTDLLSSDDVRVSEVVVKPGSPLSGRSETRKRLAQQFNVNFLAVARQGHPTRDRLDRIVIRAGDVLLLQGEVIRLNEVTQLLGCLPLATRRLPPGRSGNQWGAPLIFALAILATAFGVLPIQIALGSAVVFLLGFGLVPLRDLYTSIEWPVIVLLGSMIAIGEALQTTGLTSQISQLITALAADHGAPLALVVIFVVTMLVTDVINNATTVVIMAPVSIGVAQTLDANVDTFLMAVAIAASCAFLTPIGHQNNTIVMGPGGYAFMDYWRMGLPLQIILVAMAIPLLLLVWGL